LRLLRNWVPAFAGMTLWLGVLVPARAQTEAPTQLSGTLAKVQASGAITIGYRESSIPFSYLSARNEPIGYSIDLCKQIVDAIGEAVGRNLAIKWRAVTPESRIAAVTSGQVDLECGSTTSNLDRQKLVAFSPTFFVAGTKLMVRKGSIIRSYQDLIGRRVVVTSGTTNEKTLHNLNDRFKLGVTILVGADHEASFEMLSAGEADAFATDDVLLYGLIAQNKVGAKYIVVGDFLSYDPYGVMYRKGDPQMTKLVDETFQRLAEDREMERRYTRWFLRKLPSGVSLDLPMSPQLETIIQAMAAKAD
jgi:glutamate/aspartate transport system substrate-binding protein